MRGIRKIHFINRIDRSNAGDWNCNPLEYYFEYFKKFNILRHDIGNVDFNEIDKDDLVIIGGGGLFNVLEPFNLAINMLLMRCSNVIAWSCGFNTHNERLQADTHFSPIDLNRFLLLTVRDYDHPSGIDYLPCPSVKALYKDGHRKPIRKFGVIFHHDMPEIGKLPFDCMSNSESISDINSFILDSEAIITNSYHCAYWASLLERKAIVANKFSTKFDYYKYQPEFVEISLEDMDTTLLRLENAFENASVYKGIMEEAEKLNDTFAEKIIKIIKEAGFKESNDYQSFYLLSTTKEIGFDNLKNEVTLLNNGITWLYDKIDKIVQIEQSCILKEQLLEKKCIDLQRYLIKQTICLFTDNKRVALAGAGLHTCKLLELLDGKTEISCIVAKEHKFSFDSIPSVTYDDLSEDMADVIIISSFMYRYEIMRELQKLSLHTQVLDLYSELRKNGLVLNREFWLA